MKIAVITVTRQGMSMVSKISEALKDLPGATVDVLAPDKFAAGEKGVTEYSRPLSEIAGELFKEYRCLIMVMALGIVFRILAPHIRDKRTDPAVLVMDEAGEFVISALSGHLGRANDLALYLEKATGARAVITTATDVHGLPAVDLLARDYNLAMEPFELVRTINAAIVNGEKVEFYSQFPVTGRHHRLLDPRSLESFREEKIPGRHYVFLTNQEHNYFPQRSLFLRPRNLVAGIGCRKGVEPGLLLQAVKRALKMAEKSASSLCRLATVDIRANEQGVIQAAEELGVPLVSFTREEINKVFCDRGEELTFSPYVFEKIGVGGVCEPVALLAASGGRLILKKQAMQGITVAVAEEDLPSLEPAPAIWTK